MSTFQMPAIHQNVDLTECQGADVKILNPEELPTWKLYLDFQMRRIDFEACCEYLDYNRSKVENAVRGLNLKCEDLEGKSANELEALECGGLPPGVVTFYICAIDIELVPRLRVAEEQGNELEARPLLWMHCHLMLLTRSSPRHIFTVNYFLTYVKKARKSKALLDSWGEFRCSNTGGWTPVQSKCLARSEEY
ncbi:hypothetical protein COCSUDRAFT_38842 [Coccomyxa subellipsoidea C-169]|uniref:Uncharacterized protein n=1 Tax=Coccomyxa subellipsoidea (strain C-169) TaxID=574566 RepID=I0Z8W0_COCSC|nr:hypothetical protein COCSUDRAFT_38842 [Coccomyxa subellipsoidea C-169]EIE27079.1 hypothetical protein COCSUDRAFT_38842 [Coccomyxa subellipsoidea C-169]|eukprot:XP_005651623.1 hypothetical protein COCSUDRAFT_38842 [Coccomyxa subellipsoidea C-169]